MVILRFFIGLPCIILGLLMFKGSLGELFSADGQIHFPTFIMAIIWFLQGVFCLKSNPKGVFQFIVGAFCLFMGLATLNTLVLNRGTGILLFGFVFVLVGLNFLGYFRGKIISKEAIPDPIQDQEIDMHDEQSHSDESGGYDRG